MKMIDAKHSKLYRHIKKWGQIFQFMLCAFPILLPASGFAADDGMESMDSIPGSYIITSDNGQVSFPFDLYRGDIRFKGEINGQEVHMLLDDGFMWDPLLFWGSPSVDSLGLIYDGEISVGGGKSENSIESKTASGITVSFPGVKFIDQTAVITGYASGTSTMWSGSIGQISAAFFKHFVVDINFDKMMITLIEPEKFSYGGAGVEISWKPLGFGPWSIPADIAFDNHQTVSMELMMDLGYNDQLRISIKGEHNIFLPKKIIPTSLGFNIRGEETRGYLGRIPKVTIGGYEVNDVLVGFVSEEQSDETHHEIMIGLGLLSRFNLVFDYNRQRMFIEPNRNIADQCEHNMSGMRLRRGLNDNYEVVRIETGSPAEEAGLMVGDIVTKIDGKDAADYSFWDLMPLIRREGMTISFVIMRNSAPMEFSILLRRLI